MAIENQVFTTAAPNTSQRWMMAAGAFAALLVLGALAFKIFQPVQVLPRIRLAPGFALIDETGKRVTNEDLRGQIVLYSFGYSQCAPQACAGSNQVMLDVQRRLGEVDTGGVPVRLITVSVDPQRDTPAALQSYAASQAADPQVWRFVTASDPALLKTIVGGGFEVYYQTKADGDILLDPAFILVDGWGIIRGEYRYATLSPDVERILRHLNVLGREIKYSTGPNRLAYEAAHLFLCYSH